MLVKTERTEDQLLSLVFTGRGGRHQLLPVGVHAFRMPSVARVGLDAPERIVFLGIILEAHGLGVVIEALSILCSDWPRLRLDVYGDGSDRNLVEAQVHSHSL
jgi:glycosyltransferase involved in cell wall biosynthesis